MAVVNRDLDVTEQYRVEALKVGNSTTGLSYPVVTVPHPLTIRNAKQYALGLSGTPTGQLSITRFIVGAGATTFVCGGALTAVAHGTSGLQNFSLPAVGSSLLDLQATDTLLYVTAGTNAGLASLAVNIVVQATQDIKSWF